MTRAERKALEEIIKSADRRIAQAFLNAVYDITDKAQIARIVRALEAGRYDLAIEAIGVTDEAFNIIADAVRDAYIDGGNHQAAFISSSRAGAIYSAVFRFNVRNLGAEQWLRDNSSRLVTMIGRTQRETLREVLRSGMERGANPRNVALDVVGRVQRGSNQRSGGFIGLTDSQAGWASNARRELESGDPALMRKYLRREKRDRRFDDTVRKAIKEGRPLTKGQIDTIAGRYNDRLLKLRADAIARTESLQALNASRHQSYVQAIQNGVIRADAITKRWKDSRDGRVRVSHYALHNKEASFNEPFISPLGSRLLYPGDTSQGALASDIVQCRCNVEYRVDFARGIT